LATVLSLCYRLRFFKLGTVYLEKIAKGKVKPVRVIPAHVVVLFPGEERVGFTRLSTLQMDGMELLVPLDRGQTGLIFCFFRQERYHPGEKNSSIVEA